MPKTKSKKRRDQRDPLEGFPRIQHVTARGTKSPPPSVLKKEFNSTYRGLVLLRDKHLLHHLKRARKDTDAMHDVVLRILQMMDPKLIDQFCPPWGAQGTLSRLTMTPCLEWNCLHNDVIGGQRLYYWPGFQTLADSPFKLVFSQHALQRVYQRVSGTDTISRLLSYRVFGDRCTSLELDDQGHGAWLWSNANIGYALSAIYGREVSENMNYDHYQVRTAYLPIVIEDDYAVVKTCLAPAMKADGFDHSDINPDLIRREDEEAQTEFKRLHTFLPMIRRRKRSFVR